MITKNCTIEQCEKAMAKLTKLYDGNVIFNRLDGRGKRVNFTLRVKDSKGKGAAKTTRGTRTVAACWHVHGHFFEELFKVEPTAEVFSAPINKWITKDANNWTDIDRGSMCQPAMASKLCECGRRPR
jgi:hypothetical protein